MSTDILEAPLVTAADLPEMPDRKGYEVVDGQFVELHMGAESGYVGSRLVRILGNYCEDHGVGWVWGAETGYQCFPARPKLARKPDVSFVRLGRLPGEQAPKGHVRIAPDLIVEVVSPNDTVAEINERVEDYHNVHVPLIWVIDPSVRTVLVYRADGSVSWLRSGGELDGENVVPGFRCPVDELFRTPESRNGA